MGCLHFLFGNITVQITSADNTGLLNTLALSKIRLYDVAYRDDLSILAVAHRRDYAKIQEIAKKLGANVKVVGVAGFVPAAVKIIKRPILLAFLIVTLLLSCYLPSRVLFISVEGNHNIPSQYILEIAAECGIRFGAERRRVRSEMMKNKLLERIPQLQWAGINTNGCTAVISVQEKTQQKEQEQNKNAVSSIIAARDGVIQSCTVLRGNPLCSVGQVVKAGQILVSGYLDCGMVTKTTQACAEVRALTFRELELIAPSPSATKGELVANEHRYSLKIGKKLIKFYKDSGNLGTGCGKIYLEEYVRLPGGFTLPIAIVKETTQYYKYEQTPVVADWDTWLTDFARTHLKDQLVSGEIISEETALNPMDGACYLYGKFACVEMIGQVKYEQTIPKDG